MLLCLTFGSSLVKDNRLTLTKPLSLLKDGSAEYTEMPPGKLL